MTKIRLPSNIAILYGLAITQTLGMAAAAYTYVIDADWLAQGFAVLRGLLAGAMVSFALALLAHELPRVWQTKRRRYVALMAGTALLIVAPVYMAPAAFLDLTAVQPHALRVIAAICYALIPDAAAIGVAALSGALQAAEPAQSQPEAKPKRIKPAFVCSCGFEATSQAALNGHKLKHKPKKPNFDVDAALKPFEDRSL